MIAATDDDDNCYYPVSLWYSKGNDYWVWIHVYLCSNWANKHTHLNNYLLYLPIEAKLPNTCFQLYFPYPSCSDITWSGEYCTVYIHYSSQLFIISSGNRIDKVFSSLLNVYLTSYINCFTTVWYLSSISSSTTI